MNCDDIDRSMPFVLLCKTLIFSGHAIGRMFERGISKTDIRDCIENGDVIEKYPDDTPYPSVLMIGTVKGRPIHVVLAIDVHNETCIIVTAYEPTVRLWEDGFKKRRLS